jgi:glycosyltransferase involved in cell wall biosynthesis
MSHSKVAPARRRISVGLPVYNGAVWLSEAIDSLLEQTYGNFELIISDNGSTDETRAICEQYAARDKRIRYERHETNRGLAWNWNRVFELSNSDYFKWAAYDDLYHPTFLERCLEILEDRPDVVWCHSRTQHINDRGELLLGRQTPEISYVMAHCDGRRALPCRTSARPSERFCAVLLGRGGCLDSYGLIRSEVLRKTALYLPFYGSEKVLMAELALRGRYAEIPEPLCFARVHEKAAGNLRTQSEQRRYMNPFARKWQSDRLGLLRGYLAAVRRAELPAIERVRCYATVGQYLLQIRKWKSVLKKALTGAGLAAEYPSFSTQGDANRRCDAQQPGDGEDLERMAPPEAVLLHRS